MKDVGFIRSCQAEGKEEEHREWCFVVFKTIKTIFYFIFSY